jgi:mannosyltransferase OCH1-like enzyme
MVSLLTQLLRRRRVTTSRIPRELRFIWGLMDGGDEVPAAYAQFLGPWRALHDTWGMTVHTRREIYDVAEHYADYPFASYPKDVQRSDVCRPMLLHRFGGVYSDLDVEPHACLDELFNRYPWANVILGVEINLSRKLARRIGQQMPIRRGVPEVRRRVANYFMASVPGHPFWLDVLERMKARAHLPVCEQYDILYTTGPDIITETIHQDAARFSDVAVVPKRVLDRFITHHCAGRWRDF